MGDGAGCVNARLGYRRWRLRQFGYSAGPGSRDRARLESLPAQAADVGVIGNETKPAQPRLHRPPADVEPFGQPVHVAALLNKRFADQVLWHKKLSRELVCLALLALPHLSSRIAAALRRPALWVQHEVADLVGDREAPATLARLAVQHDGMSIAERLEGGLAVEWLASRALDDLQIERAHDVTQRHGFARHTSAS